MLKFSYMVRKKKTQSPLRRNTEPGEKEGRSKIRTKR